MSYFAIFLTFFSISTYQRLLRNTNVAAFLLIISIGWPERMVELYQTIGLLAVAWASHQLLLWSYKTSFFIPNIGRKAYYRLGAIAYEGPDKVYLIQHTRTYETFRHRAYWALIALGSIIGGWDGRNEWHALSMSIIVVSATLFDLAYQWNWQEDTFDESRRQLRLASGHALQIYEVLDHRDMFVEMPDFRYRNIRLYPCSQELAIDLYEEEAQHVTGMKERHPNYTWPKAESTPGHDEPNKRSA